MPEMSEKKARRTKSARDLSETETAQAVPQHILNIVKNVEKRAKKSKKGKHQLIYSTEITKDPPSHLIFNFLCLLSFLDIYLFLWADVLF